MYNRYVSLGKMRKTIKARELWYAILDAQMETGTPYMLYKDACNAKSNQQNLGESLHVGGYVYSSGMTRNSVFNELRIYLLAITILGYL